MTPLPHIKDIYPLKQFGEHDPLAPYYANESIFL